MARDRRPWRQGRRQSEREIVVVRGGKNPGLPAVLSVFICGLGQIYNGQFLKAVIFFIAFALCAVTIPFGIGILLTPIMWLTGIIDAYKSAESINR